MYALFGFLGILLLLAGLLPVRVLPGFLRGRPRKERRAMWVSGLIIVLIAGAFTPSDDESRQEVASNESKAAAAADPVATTSPLPQPAADGTPETTSRPTASPAPTAPREPTTIVPPTSEPIAAAAAPSTVTEAAEATRLEALFGLLAELRTAVENDAGYDRSDYDHDRRYLCNTAGVDPYTGLRFESSTCDVDHIVAAKEAHESGGHAWDRSTRRQFGDDALNLVASRDCVNRSKGSRDPAEWSGVRSGTCGGVALTTEGRCFWAARTVAVKYRYDLAVDTAERAALRTSLTNCPDNIDIEAPPRATPKAALPTSTSPATATTTAPPTSTSPATATTTAPPTSTSPATATTTAPPTSTSPATATTTAPQTGGCHPAYEPCLPNLAGDALNCGDLTSAQHPVRVKKIGVDPYRLDRDQDGNGCE